MKINKLLFPILISLSTIACEEPEDLDEMRSLDLYSKRDSGLTDAELLARALRDAELLTAPDKTDFEDGWLGNVGWLCCEGSWADSDCIGLDGVPDGTCEGDYYYCEVYFTNPISGLADCLDEFGQG